MKAQIKGVPMKCCKQKLLLYLLLQNLDQRKSINIGPMILCRDYYQPRSRGDNQNVCVCNQLWCISRQSFLI